MMAEQVHRFLHRAFHRIKAFQPAFKINAAIAHHVDVVLRDAPLNQVLDDLFCIHAGNAAVGVADDHHFLHSQFHNAHQQAAYRAVEGTGNHAAGIFNHFHVPVTDAQSGGEQLHQPGVHAGEDGDFFVGIFAGSKFPVFLVLDKGFVVSKHFVDHRDTPFLFLSAYRKREKNASKRRKRRKPFGLPPNLDGITVRRQL